MQKLFARMGVALGLILFLPAVAVAQVWPQKAQQRVGSLAPEAGRPAGRVVGDGEDGGQAGGGVHASTLPESPPAGLP